MKKLGYMKTKKVKKLDVKLTFPMREKPMVVKAGVCDPFEKKKINTLPLAVY